MGARSKKHGLTGIESRRPKSRVSVRVRKKKLSAKKQEVFAELRAILKSTPEVSE